jgi:hypothetical protein
VTVGCACTTVGKDETDPRELTLDTELELTLSKESQLSVVASSGRSTNFQAPLDEEEESPVQTSEPVVPEHRKQISRGGGAGVPKFVRPPRHQTITIGLIVKAE